MSTSPRPDSLGAIRLEDLIALNDELASLVRAGMPLEGGLRDVARDLPGRLGDLSKRISDRMDKGASLSEAFSDEREGLPEVYADVVSAGIRSGKLSRALEGLSEYASGLLEMRRAIGLALVYPILVALLAYGLILLFILFVAPRLLEAFAELRVDGPPILPFIEEMSESLWIWAPIPPILTVLLAFWWIGSGMSGVLRPGRLGALLERIPGLSRILADARASGFADILSLLVEQDSPLDEAVVLAARASADPRLIAAASSAAEVLRRGGSAGEAFSTSTSSGFPPLLAWVLSMGKSAPGLPNSLRHIGQTYRKRASNRGEVFQRALPVALMLVVGVGAALFYAMLLFLPITALWNGLAVPKSN